MDAVAENRTDEAAWTDEDEQDLRDLNEAFAFVERAEFVNEFVAAFGNSNLALTIGDAVVTKAMDVERCKLEATHSKAEVVAIDQARDAYLRDLGLLAGEKAQGDEVALGA